MKKTVIALNLVLMACLAAAPGAMSAVDDNDKPIVSLTPYVGYGFWSKDLGLDDSFMYGGRAAFHFLNWLSLEGTYGLSSADRALDGVGVDLGHYGVDLVFDLLPRAKFVPYIAGGWSQLDYKADGADRTQPLNGAEVGVGVKTRLGGNNANYRALRLDIRDVMSNLNPDFPNDDATTHNIVATLGVQFAFGKSSKDGDNDGVRDRDDDCPATPVGATINAVGCPTDTDGDGVYDGIDKCPDTPVGALVCEEGCPTDNDGDGVYDGLDKCGNTPAGAIVGPDGCPLDGDGDGVYDGLDKCPDTRAGLQVDPEGCSLAKTELEIELLNTGVITTSLITFETESAVLDEEHSPILKEIGTALSNWPELKIEIGGYTDSTGSEAYNMTLSEKRALSVLDYLKANYSGIHTDQYTVVGYGEANPVADNSTAEGRAANRRVEFKVLNTEALQREIEKRILDEE